MTPATAAPVAASPARIIEVGMGFWPAKVLLSAIELKLFTELGGTAMTGAELQSALELHPRANPDFLDTLVALGFLHRDGDGPLARYRNTEETALFLDRASPQFMLLAASLAPLGSTMIAIALPGIGQDIGVEVSSLTPWLVTSYLIASIALQSPGGKLGDLIGHGRAIVAGLSIVAAGSLLGLVGQNAQTLGAARILMASGGAATVPATIAILRNQTAADRRARIFGLFGACMNAFTSFLSACSSTGAPCAAATATVAPTRTRLANTRRTIFICILSGSGPTCRPRRDGPNVWNSVQIVHRIGRFLDRTNTPLSAILDISVESDTPRHITVGRLQQNTSSFASSSGTGLARTSRTGLRQRQ